MVEAMLKLCSGWSPDSFLTNSYPEGDHSYSFENSSTDENNEIIERYEEFQTFTDSPIHSVSGSNSDASDWANFEDDMSSILPVTDGSVSMLLGEGLVESIGIGDLNWSELESFTDQTVSSDSILESTGASNVPRKHKKRKWLPDHLSPEAQWSMMSPEEQLGTIEALTQIISQDMTLREQIEIISVIDPSAVISPNDTEFTIDLESLNDTKLQVIKDIVKKHAIVSSGGDLNMLPPSSDQHKCISSPHLPPKIKSSKKQAFEKRPYLKEIEFRRRKLLKQNKKEKRSGLFLHEKKIKRLNSKPQEEDEDVNILD